jgi:hypothetical protein
MLEKNPRLMCPKCTASHNISTERRFGGNSICNLCGYTAKTREFFNLTKKETFLVISHPEENHMFLLNIKGDFDIERIEEDLSVAENIFVSAVEKAVIMSELNLSGFNLKKMFKDNKTEEFITLGIYDAFILNRSEISKFLVDRDCANSVCNVRKVENKNSIIFSTYEIDEDNDADDVLAYIEDVIEKFDKYSVAKFW